MPDMKTIMLIIAGAALVFWMLHKKFEAMGGPLDRFEQSP